METATNIYRIGANGLEPVTPTTLERGQIVWLNGYGQDQYHHERKVVFEIETTRFGDMYHTVNIDSHVPKIAKQEAHAVRPAEQLCGIGTYYNNGEMFEGSEEELEALVAEAYEHERRVRAGQEAAKKETERIETIGGEVWEKMQASGAVSLITAELRVDESDIMTDYFYSRTSTMVVIGISKHKRNLFPELRKVAATSDIPEVAALADAPKEWEHRDNYAQGAGYYLGKMISSGWIVRKHTHIYCDQLRALGRQSEEEK